MTQSAYQLWLATWNAGLKSGLSTSEALALADSAAAALKE